MTRRTVLALSALPGPTLAALTLAALTLAVLTTAAAPAAAQAPSSAYNGLHFSVAAPQGASWRLNCRFPPVRMMGTGLVNEFKLEGVGPQSGRLPSQSGRCEIAKSGGAGAVGLALVKDGQPSTAGTALVDAPARLNVF